MIYTIIDLETSGLNSDNSSIIEIGAVKVENDVIIAEYNELINPHCKLSDVIVDITGITDEMLVDKPSIEDVLPSFLDFIDGTVLIAHNAKFESSFLKKHIGVDEKDWLDTIHLSKIAFPFLNSYSLGELVKQLGLLNEDPHRALADAKATQLLFAAINKKLSKRDKGILQAISNLYSLDYPNYADYINSFITKDVVPKYMPVNTKDQLVEDRDGFDSYQLNTELIKGIISDEKSMSKVMTDYKLRESQVTMCERVSEAFNHHNFLLAEAGTGTGKTMAYLLPAAFMAREGGNKVIVSTHTIHLQDQIVKKDIPAISSMFNGDIRSTIVKGRSHYLCLRKWKESYKSPNSNNIHYLAYLLSWVVKTTDGDCGMMNFTSWEKRLWDSFAADSESCNNYFCSYYKGICFIARLRKRAENSDIIVINHSLLLTDSMMTKGVLPESDYLIIDEAHQLEKVAEEQLGFSYNFAQHLRLMGDVSRFNQKQMRAASVGEMFMEENYLDLQKSIKSNCKKTIDLLDEFKLHGDELFVAMQKLLQEYQNKVNLLSKTLRIDKKLSLSKVWCDILVKVENYSIVANAVSKNMQKLKGFLEVESDNKEDINDSSDIMTIGILINRLEEVLNILSLLMYSDENNMVAWLEENMEKKFYPNIKLAPLDISGLLAENLYKKKNSIAFVSATLSVKGKFDYFKKTCGIDKVDKFVDEIILESPFNYDENVNLVVASDMPMTGIDGELSYINGISKAIIDMVIASNGRAMVLFTSHYQLKEVYNRIKEPLAEANIKILAHDITGNRNMILEGLRNEPQCLILGANSFWEGIDISGDNLSLLIIAKLPFWPPDMPTIAARLEKLEDENRNPFYEYSLPQAVIRFKQGFGRLIRQEGDRGIVCVLDRRVVEKRYGSSFIGSLPISHEFSMTIKDICNLIYERI